MRWLSRTLDARAQSVCPMGGCFCLRIAGWRAERPLRRVAAWALLVLWVASASVGRGNQRAQATSAMVVSDQHLATKVGVEVLKRGGSAVDAAVAVGYALAVVHPCCGNLGGGGFLLARFADGKVVFADFRERASLKATREMFLDEKGEPDPKLSQESYLAVAVPGSVAGLEYVREKYGTMSRKELLTPAIELAEEGFVLQEGDVAFLRQKSEELSREANVARIFLRGGAPYAVGERLVQKELARTLRLIRDQGAAAFYRGEIARKLAASMEENGGLVTLEDLSAYQVKEREPITCSYRGHTLISAPPPSSGGVTLCQILNILEGDDLAALGWGSAKAVHLMVEAMRYAFSDRNEHLGDPDFVENPVFWLTSKAYARSLRQRINPKRATSSARLRPGAIPREGGQTTHVSIVDEAGNAVAMTTTINLLFGNKKMAGDLGFFLNNEMDDFTAKPGTPNAFGLVQGEKNAIAPGKRPLSSMTPTIVLKEGRLFLVLGSPGGSRIITSVLQVFLHAALFGQDIGRAVALPRFHHQWLPDEVWVEAGALSPQVRKTLQAMGHKLVENEPWGAVMAILVEPKTGELYGGADPRRPAGLAAGY